VWVEGGGRVSVRVVWVVERVWCGSLTNTHTWEGGFCTKVNQRKLQGFVLLTACSLAFLLVCRKSTQSI